MLLLCVVLLVALETNVRAGAWTLDAGRLWVKLGTGYLQADRKFASTLDTGLTFSDRGEVSTGDRIPFDPSTGGSFQSLSTSASVRLGLLRWLQLGADVPLLWSDFDTTPVDSVDSRLGLGDVRLSTQVALPLDTRPMKLAGRLVVKVPTGDFQTSIFEVPLTEGQVDVAAVGSVGLSLHPYGYANVELGWRVRLENPTNRRDPGDELFYTIEGGLHLPRRLMLKLVTDGLVGQPGSGRAGAATIDLPRRRLYSLWTGLLWQPIDRLTLEIDGRFFLAGEDFPNGVQVFASAAYELVLWGEHQ